MNSTTETPRAVEGELLKPAEVVAAERVADASLKGANAMVIDSREGYEAAGEELQTLRDRYREIEKKRVHLKEPFLEGGRRIDAFFKVPLDRLQEAAEAVKGRMLTFQRAEEERVRKEREEAERIERERQAELRRQQEEVERQQREAQEERERLAKVERERQAELERKLEEERQAAQAAGDAEAAAAAEQRAAEERQRLEAQAAEEQRAAEERQRQADREAQELQDKLDLEAVTPAAPVVVSQARASGTAVRKTWKATGVDKRELVLGVAKAITDGSDRAEELLAYLLVDESALNKVAGLLKASARVPGVTFGEVANIATTGRGRSRAGG